LPDSSQELLGAARILLAEDNSTTAELIADYLQDLGYEVERASDGAEAVSKAAARPPGLILMDVHMPVMDGLQAIRSLRADDRLARVPIVALAALAMPGDRENCVQAGATGYLEKPVDLATLAASVASALHEILSRAP
jgi:CheY-like chemotaxis protein